MSIRVSRAKIDESSEEPASKVTKLSITVHTKSLSDEEIQKSRERFAREMKLEREWQRAAAAGSKELAKHYTFGE